MAAVGRDDPRTLALGRGARKSAGECRCAGGLAKGLLYRGAEVLVAHEYKNVNRWADTIGARSAVKRGRIVNRLQGDPKAQLRERHDASDFELRTEDKIGAKAD